MEREDKLSFEIEEYNHKQKFNQKDLKPPSLPPYLTDVDNNPLKNIPVQQTPQPNAPMTDNFVKYQVQLKLPDKIDFSKVTILWSKEKEDEEEEKRKQEEIRRQKEAEHKRLTDLVNFSQQVTLDIFEQTNNKGIADKINKLINSKYKTQEIQKQQQQETIDITVNVGKSENNLYQNEDDIYAKYILEQHSSLSNKIQKALPNIKAMLSDIKQFEPQSYQRKIKKQEQNGDDLKLPQMNSNRNIDQESAFFQALELNAPQEQYTETIEIKNENMETIDALILSNYQHLTSLNLSMNKIGSIQSSFDCPSLKHLWLSDNLIKEINGRAFIKCQNLQTLYLNLNQIQKIENLQNLKNLEELDLSSNQLSKIEGISSMIKLRKLNLSFNRIQQIENLQANTLLEYLDLGKNFIQNIDHLTNNSNQFLLLTELYLYSNYISALPSKFSFAQLKILSLNRNQDLSQLKIGYCPLLEVLNVSYCSISQMSNLYGAYQLKDFDLSFNQLESFDTFIEAINSNKNIRNLKFNDNPFSANKEQIISNYLTRKFNFLQMINGESLSRQIEFKHCQINQKLLPLFYKISQLSMIRGYIIRLMSSKIRIIYFATTYIMKYNRYLLPYTILDYMENQENIKFGCFYLSSYLKQNYNYVNNQRNAAFTIQRCYRQYRIKRKALLKRMKVHEDKLTKIQAIMKGSYVRLIHKKQIEKIKKDAPKKTKKYQQLSKLQANIKGFLFRKRRVRALQKLGKGNYVDEIDELEEFDVDKFFNVKEDNFDQGLELPNEQLMQQMIQMMGSQHNQVASQQTKQLKQSYNNESILPPIQNNQNRTSMGEMIKPKSMTKTTGAMANSSNQYFYGQQRPPSSGSNAISEIDMNSDNKSQNKVGQNKQNVKKNNLLISYGSEFPDINQTPQRTQSISGSSQFDDQERQSLYSNRNNPFYPPAQSKQVQEKKANQEKINEQMKDWGFQNEESKKIFEARMKKRNNMKGKNKKMTADEKYQKFLSLKNANDRKQQ